MHFLDTFRFLLGEIESIYACLRRLNPVIHSEESGQVVLGFASGATAILDASKKHLELDADGGSTIKPLGYLSNQYKN